MTNHVPGRSAYLWIAGSRHRENPEERVTPTVEQMANDARAVMRDLGWESTHVVGHSLGGLIALQLALAHRQAVRSLSLLCTFADGRNGQLRGVGVYETTRSGVSSRWSSVAATRTVPGVGASVPGLRALLHPGNLRAAGQALPRAEELGDVPPCRPSHQPPGR